VIDTLYMNNEKCTIILTNIVNIRLLMCESNFLIRNQLFW